MHIAIIGNGIAGITAARHIRKWSDHRITVISGESEFFFSRTAIMYIYMGHMKFEHSKPYEDWFWKKNRIELIHDWVTDIDPDKKVLSFKSALSNQSFDKLIIATGSNSNKFDWPGQDLEGVQGLYHLQDLHLMEQYTKDIEQAVVVGGGLIGVEVAEMLHSRGIHVTFLVREDGFFRNVLPEEESAIINKHLLAQGIDLRLDTELAEILDDKAGKVSAVKTKSGEEIPCQWVGLCVGVHPNIQLIREKMNIACDKGILVDEFFASSIPDVYAIGDCAQLRNAPAGRKAIEPVWYVGKIQGEFLANNICKTPKPYDPGIWYNSAKFFDIEYQTYGSIPNAIPENSASLYWQNTSGNKCIRIMYDKSSGTVQGFNLLGIRYRHEVCDSWICEKRSIEYVLEHLDEANFDPEFSQRHEAELRELWNSQYPDRTVKAPGKPKGFFQKLFS